MQTPYVQHAPPARAQRGLLISYGGQFWIGFLTFDIYLAHSVNQFRSVAEYIPLYFSAASPGVLLVALSQRSRRPRLWKLLGHIVGWAAILVGLAGVILHLESHFFDERTLRSLTYSAPFAAPLAYTGLGFLLVMNRMVDANSIEAFAIHFARRARRYRHIMIEPPTSPKMMVGFSGVGWFRLQGCAATGMIPSVNMATIENSRMKPPLRDRQLLVAGKLFAQTGVLSILGHDRSPRPKKYLWIPRIRTPDHATWFSAASRPQSPPPGLAVLRH